MKPNTSVSPIWDKASLNSDIMSGSSSTTLKSCVLLDNIGHMTNFLSYFVTFGLLLLNLVVTMLSKR
jgi:hypothetical protein